MSKTPVSILQEYCARISAVPQYDLVVNGVGTHDPLFKYRLTVCEVTAYGSGKSKKEAKHDAAREALTLLPVNQFNKNSSDISNRVVTEDPVDDITSPYHGALKENAIGELITICANNKLPDPEYKMTGEEGPPHAKLFTYECHVANLIETAASRTKKQAKHLSAKNMLERLKTVLGAKLDLSPTIIDKTDSKEIAEEEETASNAKTAFVAYKTKKKVNENFDLQLSAYHKVNLFPLFRNNPYLSELLCYCDCINENKCDPLELLENLFCEIELKCEFKRIPAKKTFFLCELDTSPFFTTVGAANTEVDAKRIAAHRMLTTIKQFCQVS